MELNIPLQEMEALELKYGIDLHLNQFEDPNIPDSYELIDYWGDRWFLGNTLDEVKKELRERYGY